MSSQEEVEHVPILLEVKDIFEWTKPLDGRARLVETRHHGLGLRIFRQKARLGFAQLLLRLFKPSLQFWRQLPQACLQLSCRPVDSRYLR